MSAYKQLTSKDIIVTPFTVHASASNIDNNTVSQFSGSNASHTVTGSFPTNTIVGTSSVALVYNSIKQLFYSNYLEKANNEDGLPLKGLVSKVGTSSFNTDGTIEGPIYTPSFENYPTSMNERRYFPTQSNAKIAVATIGEKAFGSYIKPGSVTPTFKIDGELTSPTTFIDNGEGEIVDADNNVYGNIFYYQGIGVYTGISGSGAGNGQLNFTTWVSSYTIYETQFNCTIRPNEFNYSFNPSLLSSSLSGQNKILDSGSSKYSEFATGSNFSPYITTIGLYNNDYELMAVAKLSQPLETSQTTDTTILINIDK
tara:strand:- start:26 stop:964 length:939 start_codon:yes stop_codon:yes gene_type:complete